MTLTPEEAKALAKKLEKTGEGLSHTLEELNNLESNLKGEVNSSPKTKKKPKGKKSKPSNIVPKEEKFTLEFLPLSAQDLSAIAEIREAQTYQNFMDYYKSLENNPERRLTALFKKVFYKKGTLSLDLSEFKFYSQIGYRELENIFKQTLEERKEYFEIQGDFNYNTLNRMREESLHIKRDLALKLWLAKKYPQEILALSTLINANSSTTGLLFKSLSEIDRKENAINKSLEKHKDVKRAEKELDAVYFSENDMEFLRSEGLI